MESVLCFFGYHRKIKRIVKSDYLIAQKGNGRNIAAFSGEVHICNCGSQIFTGNRKPWYEGSKKGLTVLKYNKGF